MATARKPIMIRIYALVLLLLSLPACVPIQTASRWTILLENPSEEASRRELINIGDLAISIGFTREVPGDYQYYVLKTRQSIRLSVQTDDQNQIVRVDLYEVLPKEDLSLLESQRQALRHALAEKYGQRLEESRYLGCSFFTTCRS